MQYYRAGFKMDLIFKTSYWDDRKSLDAFKEFQKQIHGLDFTAWEEAGYWDETYTPFSFFKGDSIVASACIYLLDAVIEGEESRLAQVSGVGTLPEWRRRGLNRRLTEIGLDRVRGSHDGIFLFADPEAIPFYRRCGFRPVGEFVETVDAPPVSKSGGAVKLNPGCGNDLERIYDCARKRTPVSDKFFILNEKLLMFHVLYGLGNHVYEIPDLDCLVFFKREGGCLRIIDIVSERIPRMKELHPYIADETDKTVEFYFYTDKLGISGTCTRRLQGNHPFVKGAFPVENPVFPFTSKA